MITVKRNGTDVAVEVTLFIPGYENRTFSFTFDTGREYVAGLLSNEIKEVLYKKLQIARSDAYNQGWKDAKSHKAKKETWFNGTI